MKCPACGFDQPASDTCAQCGNPLNPEPEAAPVPARSSFGAKIGGFIAGLAAAGIVIVILRLLGVSGKVVEYAPAAVGVVVWTLVTSLITTRSNR